LLFCRTESCVAPLHLYSRRPRARASTSWSDSGKAVGALVLGLYDGKALTYVGRVTATAANLWKQLQPLRTDGPPFAQRLPSLARKGVVWVRPELGAEVAYKGWTSDGLVRHASFKALREDKDPHTVVRES
jgi:bifunctional non-homologous end joining protein LigD